MAFVWALFLLLARWLEVRQQRKAFGVDWLPTEPGIRILPEDARGADLYEVQQIGDGRGLARALCPGADQVWLAASRIRAPRPLTLNAVGRWADGTHRHCVTLTYIGTTKLYLHCLSATVQIKLHSKLHLH